MDTTKANIENNEILLEFETIDEERYAVSIIEEIRFQKKLKNLLEITLDSLIKQENSRNYFMLFNSELGNDMIIEAVMEKLDIDINKIQD